MIKTYTFLLSIFFFLSSITLSAQASLGRWQWAQQQGGTHNFNSGEDEEVRDICTDRLGNVYAVGKVYKDPDFDNHLYVTSSAFGLYDAFISKYDKCGHLKWVRFGGGTGLDQASEVLVDDSLNVYVLGTASSNLNQFPDSLQNSTTTSKGLFWAKYDSIGNLKWVHFARSKDRKVSFPSLNFKANGNLTTEIVVGDTGTFYPGFNYRATHACNALFDFDRNGNPVKLIPIDSAKTSYTALTLSINDISYDSRGNIGMPYMISEAQSSLNVKRPPLSR